MTELVLLEHSTGFYLFEGKKLRSSLVLSLEKMFEICLEFADFKANALLVEFLNPFINLSICVDGSLLQALKKYGFSVHSDLQAMRDCRTFFYESFSKNHDFSKDVVFDKSSACRNHEEPSSGQNDKDNSASTLSCEDKHTTKLKESISLSSAESDKNALENTQTISNCVSQNTNLFSAYKHNSALAHMLSRHKIANNDFKDDTFIIQSVEMLDILEKDVIRYMNSFHSIYSQHFPELKKYASNINYFFLASIFMNIHENLDLKINKFKDFLNSNNQNASDLISLFEGATPLQTPSQISQYAHLLSTMDFSFCSPTLIDEIAIAASYSIGYSLSPADFMHLNSLSNIILDKLSLQTKLHEYLSEKTLKLAPNLCALLGYEFTARLLSKANSINNLVKMPASTIQLLGAEKALFRALKLKSNTPKYGIIYDKLKKCENNTDSADLKSIQNLKKHKARLARFLASKIALAAKIDFFGNYNHNKFGLALLKMFERKVGGLEKELTQDVFKKVLDEINSEKASIQLE